MDELKFQEWGKVDKLDKIWCPHKYGFKSYFKNNPHYSSGEVCKHNEDKNKCKQCWKLSLADMRKNYSWK